MRKKASYKRVQELLDKYYMAVKEQTENGWLPLHMALNKNSSPNVIKIKMIF
jgi:hypothetical protein